MLLVWIGSVHAWATTAVLNLGIEVNELARRGKVARLGTSIREINKLIQ